MKNKRKLVRITYGMLKRDKFLRSGLKGIRVYLHNRIKNTKRIPKEDLSFFTLAKPQYRMQKVKGGTRPGRRRIPQQRKPVKFLRW